MKILSAKNASLALMFAVVTSATGQSVLGELKDATVEAADRVTTTVSTTASDLADDLGLPPVKVGVTLGLGSTSFSDNDFSTQLGFQFGVTVLLDASEWIEDSYIRTGLNFQRKGAHSSGTSVGEGDQQVHVKDVSFKTAYLELPLRYGYAHWVNSHWTLLAETGPYFAFGLWGRQRGSQTRQGHAGWSDYSERFFNDDKDGENPYTISGAKRGDIGWGLHGGALLNQHHSLMLGYDFGFVKMNSTYKRNRNLQITYTYYFM